MKIDITLIVVQYNKNLRYDHDNHTKIYFTEENKFPSITVSTLNERDCLRKICEDHFKLSFEWLEKQLYDFRITNNSGKMTAEAVYIIHTPEVIDATKRGSFLTFSKIQELQIELDPFYERAITGTGRPVLR